MNTYPPSQPPAPQKSSKKWWFLGCGGCLGIVVVILLVIGFGLYSVMGLIKKSDAYAEASQRSKNSPVIQEAIGTPIEEQFWVTGAINTNNGAGTADFIIPLSGPKGKAIVTVKATKAAGAAAWEYQVMKAVIVGGPRNGEELDLLQP